MQNKIDLKIFLTKFDIWDSWQEKFNLKNMGLFVSHAKPLIMSLDDLLRTDSLNKILKSILLDDNWDDIESIDVSSRIVGNTYVKKCIAAIAELEQREDYADIKLLIYYAIAIRFYIEKINKSVPTPSTKLSAEKSKEDFNRLKDIDPSCLTLSSNEGRKSSNYFMEEFRFSCKKEGKNVTYFQYWSSSSLIGRILSFLKKNDCIKPTLFDQHRSDIAPSQFRPASIKYLTYYITQLDSRVSITNYLNLCGGWGDRLVGALATPSIKRYIQTDPNEELLNATQQIYDTYDPAHETTVYLYDKPMEDLTKEELCPGGEKNDLVAYSPPYFKKELYHGENQSHLRYPTINEWVTEFLYKSVGVSYNALNVNGVLAINLADIKIPNGTLYKLTDCLVHYLENNMSHFFSKFSEPLIYPTTRVSNESKILLYQAKECTDVLPKRLRFSMEPWTIVKSNKAESKQNKIKRNSGQIVTDSSNESALPLTRANTNNAETQYVQNPSASILPYPGLFLPFGQNIPSAMPPFQAEQAAHSFNRLFSPFPITSNTPSSSTVKSKKIEPKQEKNKA
ncbi:hypothetical protein [Legionella drancourtii]|uniref:DNA methylase N-4/N-6 domain-containing protein n=1 Tax=Legionella drancourtii LLAP12 TaxID=658187 RepID=G9EIZ5_9GAMM|nr:hypothetical protein [Legionella drancourtii]EHL32758.1 hypothetical protein LDG_5152 [Legionella drancourtii LLAP12]